MSHEEAIKSRDDRVLLGIFVASVHYTRAFILAQVVHLSSPKKIVLLSIPPCFTGDPDPAAVIRSLSRPRGAMGPGYQLLARRYPCGSLRVDHLLNRRPGLAPIPGGGWAHHNMYRHGITFEERHRRVDSQQR